MKTLYDVLEENFEEYEYIVTDDINELKLKGSIGVIAHGNKFISFDAGVEMGVRVGDHNSILSGLEFNNWEDLHNTVTFVRLVPESMVALVSGRTDEDLNAYVMNYGYTIETY